MTHMHTRIADIHIAKSKSLKAVDFTIGLVRRLNAQKLLFVDNSFQEILRRLFEIRSIAQKGLSLTDLPVNIKKLDKIDSRL